MKKFSPTKEQQKLLDEYAKEVKYLNISIINRQNKISKDEIQTDEYLIMYRKRCSELNILQCKILQDSYK